MIVILTGALLAIASLQAVAKFSGQEGHWALTATPPTGHAPIVAADSR